MVEELVELADLKVRHGGLPANEAFGFGADVVGLPVRSLALHRGQNLARDGIDIQFLVGGVTGCCTVAWSCSSLPRIVAASACHVARCSASDRGACSPSRVSRVACWASSCPSIEVGGRPWSA